MKDSAVEDIFRGDDDEGPVCCVCSKPFESWEEEVRGGTRVCSYHAYQWDKDEEEAKRPVTRKNR